MKKTLKLVSIILVFTLLIQLVIIDGLTGTTTINPVYAEGLPDTEDPTPPTDTVKPTAPTIISSPSRTATTIDLNW